MSEINWKNLDEDKRNEIRDIYKNFLLLWEFSCKVNQNLFIHIFGEQMGKHYWEKFVTFHNRNILNFLKGMDGEAKSDLIANILLDDNLYSKC